MDKLKLQLRVKPLIGEFHGENVVAINLEQKKIYFFDKDHALFPASEQAENLVVEQFINNRWVEIEL